MNEIENRYRFERLEYFHIIMFFLNSCSMVLSSFEPLSHERIRL